MPFVIQCCDTTDGANGGAAGAGKLALCLKAVRHDNPQVVFGVFDRDSEGIKAFGLDANFSASSAAEDIKSHSHGRAHAMLLPIPEFRKDFAEAENLSMEFLFPDEAVGAEVEGKKLVLVPQDIVKKVGSKEVRMSGAEFPWNVKIGQGKKEFAEIVIKSLDDSHFVEFSKIFEAVESVI